MNLSHFAVRCLDGLHLGILVFLVAAGLTLMARIARFLNLAHGAIAVAAAYLAAYFYRLTGEFFLALPLGLVAALAIGLAFEFVVFRQLYGRDRLAQLLAAFGAALLISGGVQAVFGASPTGITVPGILSGSLQLNKTTAYPVYPLGVILLGFAAAYGLRYLLKHSRLGLLIRASASDAEMVEVIGAERSAVLFGAFVVGAVLVSLAGVLASPSIGLEPAFVDHLFVLALLAVIIGGVGSLRGAFVAAILAGMIETLGSSYAAPLLERALPADLATMAAPVAAPTLVFILGAVVLACRPAGLLPLPGHQRTRW